MSNYEKSFPCMCGNEMVTVDATLGFEDEEVWLTYRYNYIGNYPLKMRLKLIWDFLRGKNVDVGEVIFDCEVANELGWEILTKSQPMIRKRRIRSDEV